ncbi:MAG: hypothetical protein HC838_09205 [Spirulinaceae cyanobacterium RM2_2_10]|nr:hypothetical protein [Spirulinaceae cyanobacterium RM2_2_10]
MGRVALIFAALGVILRLSTFNAYTGLLTLAAALVALGSSRHRPSWRFLSILGLAGFTVGVYELVYYPLSQASGGNRADGMTILAAVGLALMLLARLIAARWQRSGGQPVAQLRPQDLTQAAHLHWAIAAVWLFLAIGSRGPEPLQLAFLTVLSWLVLTMYALGQARSRSLASSEVWVYLGLISATAGSLYARLAWQWTWLDDWWLLLIGAIALLCELSPWERWGWPLQPWRRAAVVLPALALAVTMAAAGTARTLDLLLLAAIYAVIAAARRQWRWTYASLLLGNWALGRWLFEQDWLESGSVYGFLLGLSLLYAAQVESPRQAVRHAWRLAGSSIIGLTSLWFYRETGILPLGLGILGIALGLTLQIRAFLFVGTATFSSRQPINWWC